MDDIVTLDPFMPLYSYEKIKNPEKQIVLRAYKKSTLRGVDRLVEKGRGRQSVSTESDWELVSEIISYFKDEWPNEWKEFENSISGIRHTRRSGGYNKSKEMKYVASIPLRLERLIRNIFPYQQWDKKFVNSLVRRYKIFKVGGENN